MQECITPLYPSHYKIHSDWLFGRHPHIQPDGLEDGDRGPTSLVGDQAHVHPVEVPAWHVVLVCQLLVQASPPKLNSQDHSYMTD